MPIVWHRRAWSPKTWLFCMWRKRKSSSRKVATKKLRGEFYWRRVLACNPWFDRRLLVYVGYTVQWTNPTSPSQCTRSWSYSTTWLDSCESTTRLKITMFHTNRDLFVVWTHGMMLWFRTCCKTRICIWAKNWSRRATSVCLSITTLKVQTGRRQWTCTDRTTCGRTPTEWVVIFVNVLSLRQLFLACRLQRLMAVRTLPSRWRTYGRRTSVETRPSSCCRSSVSWKWRSTTRLRTARSTSRLNSREPPWSTRCLTSTSSTPCTSKTKASSRTPKLSSSKPHDRKKPSSCKHNS